MKIFDRIVKKEPINKGYSGDKKYYIETDDDRKLLLRVSDIAESEYRKTEFEMTRKVAELGIPMSVPVEFGSCEDGTYSLHNWIEGEDVKIDGTVLPKFSEKERYTFGLKAGEILRKIHSVPASETNAITDNKIHNYLDVDDKIHNYLNCGLRFEGDEYILAYIENNRHLLQNRPHCFLHGDYHPGNMMIENGELIIIDFNRYSYGDPWEDFNCIEWDAELSPHFATGQIRGYFNGESLLEFFKVLAFYISCNALKNIHGAAIGLYDLETMMNQVQDVLRWYDNMRNSVPTWYLKEIKL